MRAKLKHALPYAKKRLSLVACWHVRTQRKDIGSVNLEKFSGQMQELCWGSISVLYFCVSTHYYPKISSAQLKPVDPAPQSTSRNNISFFLTKRCSESRSAISPPRHQSLRLALTGS
ncbi:hypothetical protein I7I51_07635 [Histoplasma capsulatum]|uniref:Uncharacterized protein n=1 Tax=Ajellomyces capsulatus TaxID=5037 RepID=A0A8A1M1A4_AJECA|nr:hypothetical protein I7I51_07635 [Histoplasma capsulatum]